MELIGTTHSLHQELLLRKLTLLVMLWLSLAVVEVDSELVVAVVQEVILHLQINHLLRRPVIQQL
jgi:hypothetical protein